MSKFRFGGTTPKCMVCGTSAYPAESITIFGKTVKKSCFNCHTCQKKLTLSDAAISPETNLLFCKTHFADQNRTLDGARFTEGPKDVARKMNARGTNKRQASIGAAPATLTQLDDDLEVVRKARYDDELEAQIMAWMEYITGREFTEFGDGTFADGLQDGVMLCLTMNALKPDIIPRINKSTQTFKQMENIKAFLQAARQEFAFDEADCFGTPDLKDGKDLNKVRGAEEKICVGPPV